jgi:hypothetical protein
MAARIAMGVVGALFILSAAAKLSSIELFERQIQAQELVGSLAVAAWLARAVIIVELTAGAALFQRTMLKRVVVPGTLLMLTGFTGYLLWLMVAQPEVEDCGCFGKLVKISPGMGVVRNVILIGLLVFAWRKLPGDPIGRKPIVAILAIVMTIGVLAAQPVRPAPVVPPDSGGGSDLPEAAKVFNAFTAFSDGSTPKWGEGDHIVAFLSLDCEHCQELALNLGALQAADESLPSVYVIYLGEESQVEEFGAVTGTAFPWMIPDPGDFFNMIGDAPPRLYLIKDGRVKQFWDGESIDLEALRAALKL